MIKIAITVLVVALFLFSQESDSPVAVSQAPVRNRVGIVEPNEYGPYHPQISGGVVAVQQYGNQNSTNASQTGGDVTSSEAHIFQRGFGNSSTVEQDGEENRSIVTQFGAGNSASQVTNGDENSLFILQWGVGNSSDQEVYTDRNCISGVQLGINNELTQIEKKRHGQTVRVIQHGNNMETTIINGW